jgi:hypothetical protein
MSEKRPPPSAADVTPSKRIRLTSTETPSPSPEADLPPATESTDASHPAQHHDTSEKYLGGAASVAGTRRGDGSGYHPEPSEAETDLPPEQEGSRRPREVDLVEPPKDDETLQREKDEEARLIDEAAKGVSIDDSELGDAKEVSLRTIRTPSLLDVSSSRARLACFPETSRQLRPAVLEERADLIRFRVVENDRDPASMILLTGLKCL